MAIRTIADSVTPASGPPDNLAELNAALAQLGARIGHGSVVGAGAVVTASAVIPPGSLVLGTPDSLVNLLD